MEDVCQETAEDKAEVEVRHQGGPPAGPYLVVLGKVPDGKPREQVRVQPRSTGVGPLGLALQALVPGSRHRGPRLPAALVQQAIFSTLGLKKCAGMLGSKHINAQGVPPVQWLTQFGEALNLAANGDKLTPLPLHEDATVEHFLELEVKLVSGEDLVAMDITNTSDPYCIVYVKGDALYRRKQKSAVRSSTLKPKWDELLKVWPIDPDCDRELVLVVEVWDHDTTSGDDFMGKFEVKLSRI